MLDVSKGQRILIVDDDPAILLLVADKLGRAGYRVFVAASGQEALDIIQRRGLPHLAIVDVNMPQMDGFEFCQYVHQFADLPIIMLTAVNEEETIVRGIETCAEDYVTKPFSPRELVARVERVLRRIGDFAYALRPLIEVDDHLVVDFAHQCVLMDGQQTVLTPTECKLLYILMRNAGRPATTGFLLRRLWPMEEVFEDALRVHVHRLRQKIEPVLSRPRYIVTERSIGYSFAATQKQLAL